MGSGLEPGDCEDLIWRFKTEVIDQLEDPYEEFEFLRDGLRVTHPFTLSTPIKYTHGELYR